MATKPTILLVPGLWEGPTVFGQVCTLLQASGYTTHVASHPSTGALSPGNPSMEDDIAALHTTIQQLIEKDNSDVLLVLHSAAGFLGSEAMRGLSLRERKEAGKPHGVSGIVFLAAGIAELGYAHVSLPFMDTTSVPNGMVCVSPRTTLFNDLEDAEAEEWMGVMRPQPAEGWFGVTRHCGWRDVGSVYLVCEGDRCVPVGYQERLVKMVGAREERCAAGHMVMLSQPGRVVEVIRGFVDQET